MVDNQPKPELINGIYYCSPDCSYLRGERESVNTTCALLNNDLGFYDWHLALCDEDTGEGNEKSYSRRFTSLVDSSSAYEGI